MIIHFTESCTGCRTCQLLCSLKNEGECNPSLSRIVLQADGLRLTATFTEECDECGICARYCPYGALEREA